jgi:hypothetical protein
MIEFEKLVNLHVVFVSDRPGIISDFDSVVLGGFWGGSRWRLAAWGMGRGLRQLEDLPHFEKTARQMIEAKQFIDSCVMESCNLIETIALLHRYLFESGRGNQRLQRSLGHFDSERGQGEALCFSGKGSGVGMHQFGQSERYGFWLLKSDICLLRKEGMLFAIRRRVCLFKRGDKLLMSGQSAHKEKNEKPSIDQCGNEDGLSAIHCTILLNASPLSS